MLIYILVEAKNFSSILAMFLKVFKLKHDSVTFASSVLNSFPNLRLPISYVLIRYVRYFEICSCISIKNNKINFYENFNQSAQEIFISLLNFCSYPLSVSMPYLVRNQNWAHSELPFWGYECLKLLQLRSKGSKFVWIRVFQGQDFSRVF